MHARMTGGQVVELTQDCHCLTHDGPHWLHVDQLDRDRNREFLRRGNVRGFLEEEIVRMREKAGTMRRLGIEAIYQGDSPARRTA